ncbi:Bud8p NDAI_0A03400 [Naumovozyma dairenensis CBS 421]|uniref:Bud site selection protein 8 n=1 Tax=Naumovozyma dairenensis (strain ATCC 10597 / BCRC 20456 / CBS 421 / NBRC 0211 / NRRL Y-12639) TaxID=1071378 RepID=G0W3V9_NAUDC|nr:hypothetical protein NDAI_0A03400 [Naumovozyma dairenensis CBS 421]CCD22497.1 hypothetical protein NDAI_0A03400 [Naumovozyma dairenensis CBS 421]
MSNSNDSSSCSSTYSSPIISLNAQHHKDKFRRSLFTEDNPINQVQENDNIKEREHNNSNNNIQEANRYTVYLDDTRFETTDSLHHGSIDVERSSSTTDSFVTVSSSQLDRSLINPNSNLQPRTASVVSIIRRNSNSQERGRILSNISYSNSMLSDTNQDKIPNNQRIGGDLQSPLRQGSIGTVSTAFLIDPENSHNIPSTAGTHRRPSSRITPSRLSSASFHSQPEQNLAPSPTNVSSFNKNSDNDHSYSTNYQFDDTVEPHIEEAVQLLRSEMKAKYTNIYSPGYNQDAKYDHDPNLYNNNNNNNNNDNDNIPTTIIPNSKQTNASIPFNDNILEDDQEDEFVPHQYKIPTKVSLRSLNEKTADNHSFQRSFSGNSRKTQGFNSSLLSNYITSPSKESTFQKMRDTSRTAHSSPLHEQNIPIEGPSHELEAEEPRVAKIPVLRDISGSKRWKLTPSMHLKENVQFQPLSDHPEEDIIQDFQAESELPARRNNEVQLPPTLISDQILVPPQINDEIYHLTPTISQISNAINTIHRYRKEIQVQSLMYDMFPTDLETNSIEIMQHIDNSSIQSFDSQNLKILEIYSIYRIILTILCCIVIPPFFFMIGIPNRFISEYRLLRMLMNSDHRLGLYRGFIWDVDVGWFRHLCLALGTIELICICASIAVGFGVGMTR